MEPLESELQPCAQCGTGMDKSLKFCMVCGAKPEKLRSCAGCNAKMEKHLKFCMQCGARVEQPPEVEKTCTSCGVSLDKSLKFCMVCGTKVPASDPKPVVAKPKEPGRVAPRRTTDSGANKPRPLKPPPAKPAPTAPLPLTPPPPDEPEQDRAPSALDTLDVSSSPSSNSFVNSSMSPSSSIISPTSAVSPIASSPPPIDRAPSRPAPVKKRPTPVVSNAALFDLAPPPPPETEVPLSPPSNVQESLPYPPPDNEIKDTRAERKRDTRSPSRDRSRDTHSPSSVNSRDARSESSSLNDRKRDGRSESNASVGKNDFSTREARAETLDKIRESRSPTLEMHLREIRSTTLEKRPSSSVPYGASFDALARLSISESRSETATTSTNSASTSNTSTVTATTTTPTTTTTTATITSTTSAAATAATTATTTATSSSTSSTSAAAANPAVVVDPEDDGSGHHKRGESDDANLAGASPGTPSMSGKSLREKRLAMHRTLKSRGTLKADPKVVETLILNDAFIPVPTINTTEELMQYVEDKFAHGKLVKDPDTLGQFFSFLHRPKASGFLHFCPPEHVPRVFHHCIMGAFREKSVLQEMVRGGQWKQWLVPLLTDNSDFLDHVIVVVVAVYDYVFHIFNEELSGVPIDKEVAAKERSRDAAKEAARALRRLEAAKKTELALPAMQDNRMPEEPVTRPKSNSVAIRSSLSLGGSSNDEVCELLPLGLPRDKDLSYSDFLADAIAYVSMCTSQEYALQLLASLLLKLGSWSSAKPPWALPIVAMVEWPNLFALLEVLEDVTFFQENTKNATVGSAKKVTKEFVMPKLELKSIAAVEACVALLHKLKVYEIAEVPDPDPTIFKLQQHYCRLGIQELTFFRDVRDFFLLHGTKVNKDASDHVAGRFINTLTSRKRSYGSKAQVKLKVTQYVTRCENALRNAEKRGTDSEVKSLERGSVCEGPAETSWNSQRTPQSEPRTLNVTPVSESRALLARTTSDSKRDRGPSYGGPPSPDSSVRALPLLDDEN